MNLHAVFSDDTNEMPADESRAPNETVSCKENYWVLS